MVNEVTTTPSSVATPEISSLASTIPPFDLDWQRDYQWTLTPSFGESTEPHTAYLFYIHAPARGFKVLPAVADWAYGRANYSEADFPRDTDSVMLSQEFVRARTTEFDFVISPVLPTVGFTAEGAGLDPSQPLGHCSFTAWFNQTAQPASRIVFRVQHTVRTNSGWPIGIQVVRPRFADQAVLRLTR